jgi:putative ABC transport system permease protein
VSLAAMSLGSFILQSIKHYWKGHLGLLLGVSLATAVLSGSLFVGDSVRASLRRVAELRLGKVKSGVIGGDRWFTAELAARAQAVPLIQTSGSASAATGTSRANGIQVLGVDAAFWSLSPSGRVVPIADDELAINEPLARKLGVKAGDTIIVRVEKPSAISRDAPLSGNTNEQISLRRKVASIITASDFGAFHLSASQRPPDTVFMPLGNLAGQLEKEGKINTLLSSGETSKLVAPKPSLEDFSLKLLKLTSPQKEWEISTDRVFLDEALSGSVLKRSGAYGVLTYLVNGISSSKGATPYSMVTSVDGSEIGSPITHLKAGDATITQWLAEDQGLVVGDSFDIRYFVVGLGRALKEERATFKIASILPMTDPNITRAWTPEFPGVSDVDNCSDWNPGIPMDNKAIRDKDEKYWDDYKGTPKVFVSLGDGQKLWGNRFGNHTAIRFPDSGHSEEQIRDEITRSLSLADIGIVPRDFGGEATAASKGSVDFGGLFIGLSMFLIAAALIFAALLLLFTLERRAPQMGLLLAIGWTPQQIQRAVLTEAGLVAVIGTVVGLFMGSVYTRVALAGLGGVWSGATPGLELIYQAAPLTLGIAGVVSLGVSLLTIWLTVRKIFKIPARDLLVGALQSSMPASPRNSSIWSNLVAHGAYVLAIVLVVAASKTTDAQALAGMFFGAGALIMTSGLAFTSAAMKRSGSGQQFAQSIWQIGTRNMSRRPSRSLAVLGMMAGGIFIVMAVNAFRLGSDSDTSRRHSGTGGFALIGESSLPIYEDLNGKAGLDAFGLDEEILKTASIVPFRVREGDDASCLNLNRAQNPMLVGVNASLLAEKKAFRFAGKGAWDQLQTPTPAETPFIPAIADQATAMWGLGKGVGDSLDYTDGKGKTVSVQIVALLAGSVLQGKMIIDERAFLEKFPDAAGYKFLLIDSPSDKTAELSAHLTRQLEARGLALESTGARLAEFNSVQNTYIGIFTVLGGLGVLLGTAGLGVLLARHVLERKGELGLMQALGFKQGALRSMILGEHVVLLIGGLVLGVISAAVAVWPALKQGGGDLPIIFLTCLLTGVLLFGMAICALAAVIAVRGNLIDAIRKE